MTLEPCEHLDEARSWALGTLPPDRVQDFTRHLQHCSECQAEIKRARRIGAGIADAVPASLPPAELRSRVMAAVNAEAALSRAADEPLDRTRPDHPHSRRPARAALIAAAAAGAAIAVLVVLATLTSGDRKSSKARDRTIAGTVTEVGGGPNAQAAVISHGSLSRLKLTAVAAPPEGQVYQVWLVRSRDRATPTGSLFSVPQSGRTTVSLPSLRGVVKIIVTAEPPRGSRTPTLPAVAVVPLKQ